METELNRADRALDEWEIAQRKADNLSTIHKHQTAAQVNVHEPRLKRLCWLL